MTTRLGVALAATIGLVSTSAATMARAATPRDGQWTGTDSLGKAISFVVNGNGARLYGSFVVSCLDSTVGFEASVAAGSFVFSRLSGLLCYEIWQMSGSFDSATSASGTHRYRKGGSAILPCTGCGEEVPWTATFTGPITGADLAVTKTDDKTRLLVGSETTYEVAITNLGPESVGAISVQDQPPLVEASPAWSASTGAFNPVAGVWTGPPLQSGQTLVLRVTGHVPAVPGTITNAVTVGPLGTQDPRTADNSAIDTDDIRDDCDLRLSTSGSAPLITPPSPLVLATTVTNQGVKNAEGVSLSAVQSTGIDFSSNDGACTTPFPCALGTLSPGEAKTVLSTWAVPAGYSGAEPIETTFSATSTTAEESPYDNSNTVRTIVRHPGPAAKFYVLEPCRLLDTRSSTPLDSNVIRSFRAVEACGVPPSARALALNVTVTGSVGAGHLRVFPAGSYVETSNVNFEPGQTRASNLVVELGDGGYLSVAATLTTGTVHAILDVSGYFE